MSNAIRYDSLLVDYLARELDERLAGRRTRGIRFDGENRRFVLELETETLVWELHPARGWIRVLSPTGEGPPGSGVGGTVAAEGWGGRGVRTQRKARVGSVTALPDERILEIRLDASGPDRAARLVVELMTNQWNVAALDAAGRIIAALWPREAGDRTLRRGVAYEPPAGREPRAGMEEPLEWERLRDLLADVPPAKRKSVLLRHAAWTSPLNAWAILGSAGELAGEGGRLPGDPLLGAYDRYVRLASRPPAHPRILALDRPTLYPLPLPEVADRPVLSLLAGMEAVAALEAPAGLAPEVRAALEARRDEAARRAERLHAEVEAAPGKAATLRRRADLLMAQLHRVEKGAVQAELDDFEGGSLRIRLDPTLSPAGNAESLYDRARKRQRAAERLPARVRAAVAERNRLDALLRALDRGEADGAEVERWLKEVRPAEGPSSGEDERLPYRAFRSSGGLEIRVGRSGRGNDDLTFRHSSPEDIWLHARDVAGAHVILRWTEREQNPPQRDLVEAAVLAALNSRARTSGTVPVDWTRRKYVRKPRRAPPGAVLPERVRTVFVEPDPGLPDRLGR
ncbi:MAG TPA: NFACT RNA binding domain-containing protein [Longimicrobiales bacterium]|nr:NFACT RNA binding domain-containing protein [Longimicrobiales bacterium]